MAKEENPTCPHTTINVSRVMSDLRSFKGIMAPVIEECPECGGKVKRLIGAGAGLIFKGSGFYTTDYRSDGYKESAKKDKNVRHRTKVRHQTKARRQTKARKKRRKLIQAANQRSKSTDSD